MLHKTLPLDAVELKFTGSKGRTFSGYASVFNGVDSYNDTIAPGAFAKTLKERKRPVKMFFNHKSWEMPVGKWLALKEDDKGLLVEGELTEGNTGAENLYASMKHGTVDGLSIGFRLSKDDFSIADDGERRIIKNITDLVEISPVIFPADDDARVDLDSVKSALEEIQSIRDLEAFLRDAGGFSKGLTSTLVSRAKELFLRDAGTEQEAKAVQEAERLIALSRDLQTLLRT